MHAGDVLRDKYQLVASIGRGGMGEVFHAIHLESRASVAIKVVSRAYVGDFLMARLEREAAAAARIQSDFIPRLLDVDRTDSGELFLVMELLRGDSLADRLKSVGGVLPWDEVQAIGEHVLCGLIDAHAAGVIHRDLKPANIFLEYFDDGTFRTRILDFGVCKVDGDAEKLTVTGEAVGTIAYMAPEQIRGASKVDERADIYSFAMVVFEAVSGRLAYDASGQMALLASKLERSARHLRTTAVVPVPVGLDPLVNKCLARIPGERFPTARDVLKVWRTLGPPTQQPSAIPLAAESEANSPTQTGMTAGTLLSGATPRSSRSFLAMAGAVVVGGVIALTATRTRAVAQPDGDRGTAAAAVATDEVPAPPPAPQDEATEPAVVEMAATPGIGAADDTPAVAPSARPVVAHPRGSRAPASARKPATAPTIVTTPRY